MSLIRRLAETPRFIYRAWPAIHSQAFFSACLILVAVVIQLAVPFLANTSCGLIIPHEHILAGGADLSDLEQHEAAEAACGAGSPATSEVQNADLQGHKGRVINVIRIDASVPSSIISFDIMYTAILAVPIAILQPQQFLLQLSNSGLFGSHLAIPPPEPPPRTP